MTWDMDKSIAVIFVLLLHLAFGFVLMTREQPTPRSITDAERTRLRFLERPAVAPAIVARTAGPAPSTAARNYRPVLADPLTHPPQLHRTPPDFPIEMM